MNRVGATRRTAPTTPTTLLTGILSEHVPTSLATRTQLPLDEKMAHAKATSPRRIATNARLLVRLRVVIATV